MKITEGVEMIIFTKPELWTSLLNGENPIFLEFPIRGVVSRVSRQRDIRFNLIVDGQEYGFTLMCKIDFDLITL
jgi:hypothetical protein